MDAYRTFLGSGKSEYIINKSRFIARAERISCQKDAETVLAEEKKNSTLTQLITAAHIY